MTQYKLFYLVALVLVSAVSHAEIKPPGVLNCTATKVTPEGARFFGFGKGPVVGDSTQIDVAAAEIDGVKFESGAHIGSTVTKHPLIKVSGTFEGMSRHTAAFKSNSNGQNYEAVLIALEREPNTVKVTLDVLEKRNMGRLVLNSVELDCVRN